MAVLSPGWRALAILALAAGASSAQVNPNLKKFGQCLDHLTDKKRCIHVEGGAWMGYDDNIKNVPAARLGDWFETGQISGDFSQKISPETLPWFSNRYFRPKSVSIPLSVAAKNFLHHAEQNTTVEALSFGFDARMREIDESRPFYPTIALRHTEKETVAGIYPTTARMIVPQKTLLVERSREVDDEVYASFSPTFPSTGSLELYSSNDQFDSPTVHNPHMYAFQGFFDVGSDERWMWQPAYAGNYFKVRGIGDAQAYYVLPAGIAGHPDSRFEYSAGVGPSFLTGYNGVGGQRYDVALSGHFSCKIAPFEASLDYLRDYDDSSGLDRATLLQDFKASFVEGAWGRKFSESFESQVNQGQAEQIKASVSVEKIGLSRLALGGLKVIPMDDAVTYSFQWQKHNGVTHVSIVQYGLVFKFDGREIVNTE